MGMISDALNAQKANKEILDQSQKDRVGFQLLDSNIYLMEVKDMYSFTSKGGAMGIRCIFGYGDGFNKEFRCDTYISNRDKKVTITDKDGNERPMPGYAKMNELCCLTSGNSLSSEDENVEERQKEVYDFEKQQEVLESHDTYVNVIGKCVYVGVQKIRKPKMERGADGQYYPNGETVEINDIDKFFDADTKCSLYELDTFEGADDETPPAEAFEKWLKLNEGQIREIKPKNTSGSRGGAARPARPAQNALNSGTGARRGLRRNNVA